MGDVTPDNLWVWVDAVIVIGLLIMLINELTRIPMSHRHDWEPVRVMEQGRSFPHPTREVCCRCGAENDVTPQGGHS